jgi:hypothetical protein
VIGTRTSPRAAFAALAVAVCLLAVPAAAAAGTIVADSGFRPAPNGFSFANYGDEQAYSNLDAAELERMFGSGVCLAGHGGECVLTPPARTFMLSINASAAGGHCYGFAALSQLIYEGDLPRFGYSSLGAFGSGATSTFGLKIEGNTLLQRSIARAFAFQGLPAVTERTVNGSPVQVLQALLHGALDPKTGETWTMGIFQYGFEAGHEITPYAVEDAGNGIYQVLVYDNNWPGDGDRRLTIDTKSNTWSYYAARSPGYPQAMYEGNAGSHTLELSPVTPALAVQPCPFCLGRQGAGSRFNEVRLDGTADEHADVLITDAKGRQTGLRGGKLVNQIPGAKVIPRSSGGYLPRPDGGTALFADSPAPLIRVPKAVEFDVDIAGRRLRESDHETLSLVGPTYDATVENLVMGPRQSAHVDLSPKRNAISYRPSARSGSPEIALGAESRSNAYRVTLAALGAPKGSRLTFVKEPKQQLMWFGDNTDQRRRYEVTIERLGVDGEATFTADVTISGGRRAYLYYGPLGRRHGVAKIVVYGPGKARHPVKTIPVERLPESS